MELLNRALKQQSAGTAAPDEAEASFDGCETGTVSVAVPAGSSGLDSERALTAEQRRRTHDVEQVVWVVLRAG
ncbi:MULTISPECIES: hypothetical protein [Actinomycetes]|uniref:hypothetical protein n=1 Tax=Actinomycetes TaxID=1760 RepID=UPI001319C8EC|nr:MULTISPECIES: hypothetical protein [Actinomycetes]